MKIVITNIPAFYKINLFNEVNKKVPLLVIFCAKESEQRKKDFYNAEIEFKTLFLSGRFLKDSVSLLNVLVKNSYEELIIGGWDNLLFWSSCLFSPKRKNSVIVESTDYESSVVGLKGLSKRVFLRRVKKAYCSGTPHERLVRKLGFSGKVKKTYGVGFPNFNGVPMFSPRKEVKNFLYVGRFSEEKNLKYLIDKFNNHPELILNICGYGPQEEELKAIAKENIIFHGAVNNKDLFRYYQKYDAFVLVSKSEPWGLVIEEALMNGMPVLVSDKVGCREDIVSDKVGRVVDLEKDDFEERLKEVCDIQKYNDMRMNILQINHEARLASQVECYVN